MFSKQDPAADQPIPVKRGWRWRRWLVLLVLMGVTLVAAAPWIASGGPVKSLVVARLNARLAPGSLVVDRWSLGWLEPVRIDGVALLDPQGKQVVAAKHVRASWGLLGLLLAQPDLGTITVTDAMIDVARRVDGTIDVLDALATLTKPDPAHPEAPNSEKRAIKVVVQSGTLRAISPELVEPMVAGQIEGTLTISPGKPMTLAVTLVNGESSVKLTAEVEKPEQSVPDDPESQAAAVATASDLVIQVVGKDWPLNLRGNGGMGHGRFGGTIDAKRLDGVWSATTDSALDRFEAEGSAFGGDHPMIDRLTVVADVAQTVKPAGWAVHRFELACPVGRLHAEGAVPPVEGGATKLRGQVDLVALTKILPHTLHLQPGLTIDRGTATLSADLTGATESERAEIKASIEDLAATRNGGAVVIHEFPRLDAVATRTGTKVAIEQLTIRASGVDVSGSGDLEKGVVMKGIVDLVALDAQIRDLVDLGKLSFAGHARLAADYRHVGEGYKARVAADCRDLHIVGLTDAPIHRDLVRFDAAGTGPRLADGRPAGWQTAKLDLKAGDVQADLAATHEADGTIRVGGLAASDLPGPHLGRAETKLAARWQGEVIDFDEFRAWLMPPGSKEGEQADPRTLTVAVRGKLDLGAGNVALEAIPDVAPGAVGLGAGGLKVSGWKGPGPLSVEAGLIGDLAALDGYLAARSGQPAHGWTGPWSSTLKATRTAAGQASFDAQVAAADLLGQGPVALQTRGTYQPEGDRLDLATADLTTKYAKVASHLTLGELLTKRNLDWSGTIDPRWDMIGPILAHSVEPGARIDAKVRPFHLAGSLAGASLTAILPNIAGEVGLDVASLTAFGVVAGPMPVVLKLGNGAMKFDPIATTVNGGPTFIQANLMLDKAAGLWLQLDQSAIQNAAINDAVSSSVLAFIAPVLSRATEVSGKVSVALSKEGAAFPITAQGTTRVQGVIAFNDVVFRPGPLADQVFAITGQAPPKLAFAEPVQFSIIDGRVQQSGLSIPLGGGNKVEFAGSVGFDKTLQLKATVPITAAMIGRDAQLEKLLNGLKVDVPIGGTLAKPAIDRQGLQAATRNAIRTIAGKGLKDQAGQLIERVAGAKLPASATGAAANADPKRDMIRGLIEGLGKDALGGDKQP